MVRTSDRTAAESSPAPTASPAHHGPHLQSLQPPLAPALPPQSHRSPVPRDRPPLQSVSANSRDASPTPAHCRVTLLHPVLLQVVAPQASDMLYPPTPVAPKTTGALAQTTSVIQSLDQRAEWIHEVLLHAVGTLAQCLPQRV